MVDKRRDVSVSLRDLTVVWSPVSATGDVEMHTLKFTLGPQGVVRIHDAVLCLAKFSEIVSLEARSDKVRRLVRKLANQDKD